MTIDQLIAALNRLRLELASDFSRDTSVPAGDTPVIWEAPILNVGLEGGPVTPVIRRRGGRTVVVVNP